MKPVTLVLLAAGISVVGTWAKDKTLETRQVVGIVFLSLIFIVIGQANPKFATQFGWLLVAAALGAYGEDLFKGVGGAVGAGPSVTGSNTQREPAKVSNR